MSQQHNGQPSNDILVPASPKQNNKRPPDSPEYSPASPRAGRPVDPEAGPGVVAGAAKRQRTIPDELGVIVAQCLRHRGYTDFRQSHVHVMMELTANNGDLTIIDLLPDHAQQMRQALWCAIWRHLYLAEAFEL